MKKEFEVVESQTSTQKENKPTYKLIYDIDKAKRLAKEWDDKLAEKREEASNKSSKNIKKAFVWAIVFVAVFVLSVFTVVRYGSSAAVVVACTIFGLSSLVGVITNIIFIKNTSAEDETDEYRYKQNYGEYSCPLLVEFYKKVGEKEIVRLSVSQDSKDLWPLKVTYKNDSDCVTTELFDIKRCFSVEVTQDEIDLENELIRIPYKKETGNFVVVTSNTEA